MCCRYYIYRSGAELIRELLDPAERDVTLREGEVRPSEEADVLLLERGRLCARRMRWGFLPPKGSGLLINARVETAAQKPSFSDSLMRRRCVIAASLFYEWDPEHQKVGFSMPDQPLLFMAGLYRDFADGRRFTVLTVPAGEDVAPVHDRMPLLLPKQETTAWLSDETAVPALLKTASPALRIHRAYEQLSLF